MDDRSNYNVKRMLVAAIMSKRIIVAAICQKDDRSRYNVKRDVLVYI